MSFFSFTHARICKDLENLCKAFKLKSEDLQKFDIFNLSKVINTEEIFEISKPHTPESIKEKKGYLPYDTWIKIYLKYWTEEQIKDLYQVKSPEIAITDEATIIKNDETGVIHKTKGVLYKNRNKLV